LSVAISGNSKLLASCGSNGDLFVWNLETGVILSKLEGHDGKVRTPLLAISGDGKMLVSGGSKGELNVWDLPHDLIEDQTRGNRQLERRAPDRRFGCDSLRMCPDTWRAEDGGLFHSGEVNSVAISSDNELLVCGGKKGGLFVWDLQAIVSTTKNLDRGRQRAASFRQPASRVALTNNMTTAERRRAAATRLQRWIRARKARKEGWSDVLKLVISARSDVESVVISKDNAMFVSCGSYRVDEGIYRGEVKVWSLTTGRILSELEGLSTIAYSIAISDDGKTLVSGGQGGELKVWNLETGQCVRDLEGHSGRTVYAVAVSKDGKSLVSGGQGGELIVWDLSCPAFLRDLCGHSIKAAVDSVAFSGDCESLISFGNGELMSWDLKTDAFNNLLVSSGLRVRVDPATTQDASPAGACGGMRGDPD
jgi:WD40 repeat protein